MIANHLWQSTAFTALAAALAYALRNNRASVRYWIWLAASLKFLAPFALLMGIGGRLPVPPKTAVALAAPTATVVENLVFTLPALPRRADPRPSILFSIWALGLLAVTAHWARRWRLAAHSPALEPGVFGIFRPRLMLPAGIEHRLSHEQLRAVIAHEMCHVRRDNLFAAIHMTVEAIFWFHPLVWWIGARLVEERERACDEEVLRQGADPHEYASGILEVCKLYLESPLVCVSGVTGADLKRRIEAIMTARVSRGLTLARKLILAGAAVVAIAVPLLIGIVRAQSPSFEVASIKPAAADDPNSNLRPLPGGALHGVNVTLRTLFRVAYNLQDPQISGGPSWIDSAGFNIDANGGAAGLDQVRLKIRPLLAERFHLKFHKEVKQMPVFALVVAKGGLKIKDVRREPGKGDGGYSWGRGRIVSQLAPLSEFALLLSGIAGRPVIDRTGIEGNFDFTLKWTPDDYRPPADAAAPRSPNEPPPDPNGPGLFTALQEQLGLRLEATTGPVEVFVIESAEKPSEN